MVSCFNLEVPNDVFTLYIRSVIHFEFMFMKGVRFVPKFYFFYHMDVQLLLAPFVEKTICVALYYLHSFVKVTRFYVGLFSGFCFCPVDPFVYSFASSPVSGLPLLYSKS